MKKIIILLIHNYQYFTRALGLFPNRCVFTPTCSEYTATAVEKYGARKGTILMVKRILRCHPRQKEFYDPVK